MNLPIVLDCTLMMIVLVLDACTFGENHKMKTTRHSALQLFGETVTISYVADPSVGHGEFRLENNGDVTVTAAVESAWLELGAHRQSLADVTVFDLELDLMVNPRDFKIAPKATLKFLVGFPRVTYEPRFGEASALGLRLSVNGSQLQALSPFKFVRRIPK